MLIMLLKYLFLKISDLIYLVINRFFKLKIYLKYLIFVGYLIFVIVQNMLQYCICFDGLVFVAATAAAAAANFWFFGFCTPSLCSYRSPFAYLWHLNSEVTALPHPIPSHPFGSCFTPPHPPLSPSIRAFLNPV